MVENPIQNDTYPAPMRLLQQYPKSRVSSEQRIGVPSTQVLQVAERLGADVIVLGRDTPAFLSVPMGETGEMVVNASKASVYLVP